MRKFSWPIRLGIILVLFSLAIYTAKFLVLGDPENTYYYIFNALGFLPINVLLVTLIINELLSMRSKKDRLEKLNMVIGTFFSEAGTRLLAYISDCDPELDTIRSHLVVGGDWSAEDFRRVRSDLSGYSFACAMTGKTLIEIRSFLQEKRNFLLRLLENPVLLEHQDFTELLRAVFHLTEELERRDNLESIPESDIKHLSGDVNRVYKLLSFEWLSYMRYLEINYPYLFSLAIRTNPFDEDASVIVKA
jgi:hypothetical protein